MPRSPRRSTRRPDRRPVHRPACREHRSARPSGLTYTEAMADPDFEGELPLPRMTLLERRTVGRHTYKVERIDEPAFGERYAITATSRDPQAACTWAWRYSDDIDKGIRRLTRTLMTGRD